jgi:hypothetical protein
MWDKIAFFAFFDRCVVGLDHLVFFAAEFAEVVGTPQSEGTNLNRNSEGTEERGHGTRL